MDFSRAVKKSCYGFGSSTALSMFWAFARTSIWVSPRDRTVTVIRTWYPDTLVALTVPSSMPALSTTKRCLFHLFVRPSGR